MKTKQRFLSALLMAIIMMAMNPMKMWADENPTIQLGKNEVTVYRWTVFNFTAGDAGTYRFHSEGNVDLNVSEFNGVGVFSSGAQGDNDVDGINFDWSIALEANSTNTIEIYDYAQTGNPTENCVVYVTYVGEGGGSGEGSGGSGEESNNIKIELPIRLYDKDGNVLSYYIYNANTAYFNLGSEKRSSHNQLSSGEYTFTAEDNVYGFSFVGWYDDDDNLINTEKTFTQNVENNILYLPHYKAKETTVIPDNRSFVSLEAIIEGEGEATFELDGYQGASIVFVNTGTEVTAKATSTSNTASCKISGNAEVDEGLKYYSTTESSLTFTVLGNTGLVALFSADSEGGGSGEGGETPTYTALNSEDNYVDIPEEEIVTLSFTPETTGWYRFHSEVDDYNMRLDDITLNGVSVISTAGGSDDVDAENGDYNFNCIILLTAGNTYLLKIKEYQGRAVEDCKIVVSYENTCALNVDDNTVNIYKFYYGVTDPKYFYTFTPDEPGVYTFTFSNNGSEIDVYAGFGEYANGDGADECNSLTTYQLDAGTTYGFYVDGDDNEYENATINITRVADENGNPIYTREMAYEWGTLCLPYPIKYNAKNGNHKLYTLSDVATDALTFTEVANGTVIDAGTPMAVKAVGKKNAETGKYTISVVGQYVEEQAVFPKTIEVGDYAFKGTLTEKTNQTNIYFIAQNQFWWATDNTEVPAITVPAYRAYLEGPAPTNGAKAFNIVVDENGETTAIGEISNGTLYMVNGTYYNLNGQRLSAPQKGQINIINGRKVFVK